MATIVETIEDVVDSLSTETTFLYVASLNEANLLADDNLTFPVCFMLPVVVQDTPGTSGALKSTFPLRAYFFDKITNPTTDFKANEVETSVIAPMRLLAREFMHKLNENELIDPTTKGIESRTYEPEYGLMDANLFGVYVTATVPVIENINVCLPTPP